MLREIEDKHEMNIISSEVRLSLPLPLPLSLSLSLSHWTSFDNF